ncbi:co(2)-response secreted protease [Quercus suber]|uniref:Co(2)-response secreted protease n=1 Tax=Quercus suber TaxID=58331 RepID=A0AAW0LY69_QUESU
MKGNTIFFLFCSLFLVSFLEDTGAAQAGTNYGVYIVYMGAAASTKGSLRDDHAQLMSSVKENTLVHTYRHGFSGFAARISEEEARSIAQKPGVVSVFPDTQVELHTTRSWDFLKFQTSVKIDSKPNTGNDQSSSSVGSDSIIGILDTGIWPESESFNDKDMGPIPTRWKGTCVKADDFNSSNCNRSYGDSAAKAPAKLQTPRDTVGHGTHVASTAAGSTVASASYYGLAGGTAKGGSPSSRIAIYTVCSSGGCRGSAILAAFDDAVADGVDVLSLSLGAPSYIRIDLKSDPIAIGAFHAVDHGIIVVCSAGNDGPDSESVVNVAPWILTVAASTIDRDFQSNVVLGGNKLIKGESINFSPLKQSPEYPLIYAKYAKKSGANEAQARCKTLEIMFRNCNPDSMDKNLIKGKIVVCNNVGDENYSAREKISVVKSLGGIGIVLIDDQSSRVASTYGSFPATLIKSKDSAEVLSYINSSSNPVATILPTVAVTEYKPAPAIAYFSARGPSYDTMNILKAWLLALHNDPDIAAPGVDILAAWIANDASQTPQGKEPPLYNVISGTSMACPHVSGVAATVKSQNPTWSPSAIKSAIMTTASKNISRTVTNVGGDGKTVYAASVDAPSGIVVKVIPDQLTFTKNNEKLSYQMIFSSSTATSLKEDVFGSITWTNGKFKVRSPFVVSSKSGDDNDEYVL